MKKFSLVIVLVLTIALPANAASQAKFLINGQQVEFNSYLIKGRTMVPARLINNYFGAQLKWDKKNKELKVLDSAYQMKLKVGSKVAVVDNHPYPLSISPKLINNQVFIPARLLTKMYGGKLSWDGANKAIDYQLQKLTTIKFRSKSESSEIIFETTAPVQYSCENYIESKRLVFDFKNSMLGAINREILVKDGIVAKIRSSQFKIDPAITRVVIDLEQKIDYQIQDQGKTIKVLISDLKSTNEVVTSSIVSSKRTGSNSVGRYLNQNNNINQGPSLAPDNSKARFEDDLSLNPAKIVIDAGHGGTDPGAIGALGLKEKVVNLDIALKLQEKLIEKGYNPVLTRAKDSFISLSKRAKIANLKNADLFISIHANSNHKSWVNGTATYAHWYANKKNWALAWYIQSEMLNQTGLKDNGLKTANFAVLRETNMPAVLVETAFLSNRREEKLLSTDQFQTKVATGIAWGVEKYFNNQ